MNDKKMKFILNEILNSVILSSLGRSNTYDDSATEEEKKKFRESLKQKLIDLGWRYKVLVSDVEHLINIQELISHLQFNHHRCLADGRLRIGIAQKALNLYLKFLWSIDLVETPPHCPFDSIVIGFLPACKNVKWTMFDDEITYSGLVESAREQSRLAGIDSLSEWEMDLFQSQRAILQNQHVVMP